MDFLEYPDITAEVKGAMVIIQQHLNNYFLKLIIIKYLREKTQFFFNLTDARTPQVDRPAHHLQESEDRQGGATVSRGH